MFLPVGWKDHRAQGRAPPLLEKLFKGLPPRGCIERWRAHPKGLGWSKGASAGAWMGERGSSGGGESCSWERMELRQRTLYDQLSLLCHSLVCSLKSPRILGTLRHICQGRNSLLAQFITSKYLGIWYIEIHFHSWQGPANIRDKTTYMYIICYLFT